MLATIDCPNCGKLTSPGLEGCPHCGNVMKRPAKVSNAAERDAEGASQTCPRCHAALRDDDLICGACGTNLLTGQQVGGKAQGADGNGRRRSLGWVVTVVVGLLAVLVLAMALCLGERR